MEPGGIVINLAGAYFAREIAPLPPPPPRFRRRLKRHAKRKPPSGYRSVSGQGRRDRGAAGRYRWACRLWPHAVAYSLQAAAIYAEIAARPAVAAPEGAIGCMVAAEIARARERAGVMVIFERAEAIAAMVTPRFSRWL